MTDFTIGMYRMSSKIVVTVRIDAEVVEKSGAYELKSGDRRNGVTVPVEEKMGAWRVWGGF